MVSTYYDIMADLVRKSYRRLGFRGRFLLLVGTSYVFQGFASLDTWNLAPHDLAPPWSRAALWIVAGVIAIVTAWLPVRRPNPAGWLALYIPPALWSLSYLIGWISHLAPGLGLSFHYQGALTYALVWALVVAVILVCADWPEPPEAPHERPSAGEDEI